jgi:hypothetical protein
MYFFQLCRAFDIFGGELTKLRLGFGVGHVCGVPRAFGGLISQIGGAFGHRAALHARPMRYCSILLNPARISCSRAG